MGNVLFLERIWFLFTNCFDPSCRLLSFVIYQRVNNMNFACRISGTDCPISNSNMLQYDFGLERIKRTIKDYVSKENWIDGKSLMDDCFPEIDNVRIFISHSHKDCSTAVSLANYINQELGLKSFIDSMVWEYSNELLREIDSQYSISDDDPSLYSYDKRNVSSSYVHMMLAVSLTHMMDKCDCLIFVDTPNSINAPEKLGKSFTFSPWIYYELCAYHFLQRKDIRRDRQDKIASVSESTEGIKIALPTDISGLFNLHYSDIRFVASMTKEDDEAKKLFVLRKQLEKKNHIVN